MTLLPFVSGLATGLSLIIAIGAQNAFLLRQGIRKDHVGATVLICVLSDAVLILAGVAGFGALLAVAPWFISVARIGGAGFLLVYALFAAKRAFSSSALEATTMSGKTTAHTAVLTALALTWLNPHVYLDTVILLGSVAAAQGDIGRWAFGAGAILASTFWFVCLGFGARYLRGFFASPKSWRFLDAVVAALMLALALSLLLPVLG
ncbi:LysE/ArgO family amino acid transporter [Paeniglutamicibacter antarcticus]|uniref:LysE/ArgO family amino acid transporter n=1 Tax=Paeniglutamicibacter antarcticus TaxID=494023 RepID=A0ABP9TLX6_9MICC